MSFPSSGTLLDPVIEPEFLVSPALQANSLPAEPSGKLHLCFQAVRKQLSFIKHSLDSRLRKYYKWKEPSSHFTTSFWKSGIIVFLVCYFIPKVYHALQHVVDLPQIFAELNNLFLPLKGGRGFSVVGNQARALHLPVTFPPSC